MDHSRGGMIHCFSERFNTRKRSFVAASLLAKWIFYSEPLPAARNPLILLRRVWNLTLT
jgi:hypothetical protein